jgi:hypothetical protein
MINTVSDVRAADSAYTVAGTKKAQPSKQEAVNTQAGAASVVELQGSRIEASERSAAKVNSASAASLAGDIAAALTSQGGGVQANINGFDAARLLSD